MQATMECILASRLCRLVAYVLLLACVLAPSARAQGAQDAQGAQEAQPAPTQSGHAASAGPEPEPEWAWEGAIGLQLSNAPEYAGSDQRTFSVRPGIYLRWGPFAIASGGNYVARGNDDEIVRGLSADLVKREDLRARIGLRYDQGRKTSDSGELAQLDEVRATLRARLSVVWEPVRDWRFGAGWSNDILGRDGGAVVDFGLARDFRPSRRSYVSVGAGVSWADEQYMQARFGISPEAAERSGKPAYAPGAGLRDVALTAQWRTDIDRNWTVWVSGGVSRLLGPAADSPLTLQAAQAAVGVGAAWRF
jgi:outer membrane scaffolding protein for murein synthesis (MipA/OmpV family)